MSYMRGDYYLWDDESGLHLWAYDGYDGWDEAGWHREDDGDQYPVKSWHLKEGRNSASGVSIHQEIMDEYVMMRLAEMIQEGTITAAIDRAVDHKGRGGNFGGRVLEANADTLKQALGSLKMQPVVPYEWETVTSERTDEDG